MADKSIPKQVETNLEGSSTRPKVRPRQIVKKKQIAYLLHHWYMYTQSSGLIKQSLKKVRLAAMTMTHLLISSLIRLLPCLDLKLFGLFWGSFLLFTLQKRPDFKFHFQFQFETQSYMKRLLRFLKQLTEIATEYRKATNLKPNYAT